jgi:uncharacterized RDD family membrane protein YckC
VGPGHHHPQNIGRVELEDVASELKYASWWTRVSAALVDRLIPLAIIALGGVAEFGTRVNDCIPLNPEYSIGPYCDTGNSVLGVTVWVASLVLALAFTIWNIGYLQGSSGASIGKRVLKIRLIKERTGQPIGFGPALLRQLAHFADALFCFVGYLVPLWDAKKQTLADKIVKTVCLRAVSERR